MSYTVDLDKVAYAQDVIVEALMRYSLRCNANTLFALASLTYTNSKSLGIDCDDLMRQARKCVEDPSTGNLEVLDFPKGH